MLSRVADNLYWMSRYLERAEHTSRLVDMNLTLMLDELGRELRPALAARADRTRLQRREVLLLADGYQAARELAFSRDNASSVTWLHWRGPRKCAPGAGADQFQPVAAFEPAVSGSHAYGELWRQKKQPSRISFSRCRTGSIFSRA